MNVIDILSSFLSKKIDSARNLMLFGNNTYKKIDEIEIKGSFCTTKIAIIERNEKLVLRLKIYSVDNVVDIEYDSLESAEICSFIQKIDNI